MTQGAYSMVPVPAAWLPVGLPLPCDLFLLFEGGNKKLQWRSQGDILEETELRKFDCLHVDSATAQSLFELCSQIPLRLRTEEGLLIAALLRDDITDPIARKILLEETALQVLKEGTELSDSKDLHLWHLKIKNILLDVSEIALDIHPEWVSVLQNCEKSPQTRGNLETAGLALLMTIATGQIESSAIRNVIVASFLDGLTPVFSGLSQKAVYTFTDANWISFKQAGKTAPEVFAKMGFKLEDSSIQILQNHHGIGLRNPKYQPLSHAVSCAMLWTWFANGRWDSHRRTPKEAWAALDLLETMQALPYGVSPAFIQRLKDAFVLDAASTE